MGSPFMQKILLCRKFFYAENFLFFYAENSYMQKILLCRKFFSGRKFFYAENSSMAENSSVQKTLLFSCRKFFYGRKFFCAENSFIFMQKILLCRKISLLGPKSFSLIFSKNTDYYSNNVKLDNVYWVQNLLHGGVF